MRLLCRQKYFKQHIKQNSAALINYKISHEDFTTINLIEEGKKAGVDEINKHNEIIIISLKSQI